MNVSGSAGPKGVLAATLAVAVTTVVAAEIVEIAIPEDIETEEDIRTSLYLSNTDLSLSFTIVILFGLNSLIIEFFTIESINCEGS